MTAPSFVMGRIMTPPAAALQAEREFSNNPIDQPPGILIGRVRRFKEKVVRWSGLILRWHGPDLKTSSEQPAPAVSKRPKATWPTNERCAHQSRPMISALHPFPSRHEVSLDEANGGDIPKINPREGYEHGEGEHARDRHPHLPQWHAVTNQREDIRSANQGSHSGEPRWHSDKPFRQQLADNPVPARTQSRP